MTGQRRDDGFGADLWRNVQAIRLNPDGGLDAPVRADGERGIVGGLDAVARSDAEQEPTESTGVSRSRTGWWRRLRGR